MANKGSVNAAVVCHKGCVRGNNEDNFFFNGDYMLLSDMNEGAVIAHTFTSKHQMFCVFDGMGGGDWGERASSIAAQAMQSVYAMMRKDDISRALQQFALRTNALILADRKSQHVEIQGTTMAILALQEDRYTVANVGDSRVYILRDHQLKQLSMDHSVVGQAVRDGRMTPEQARKSPDNNVITQYLGMSAENLPARLDYQMTGKIQPGDRFMLCSDGLSDLLSESDMEDRLSTMASPLNCAKQLVLDALEMGGKDNTTCIVLDCGPFVPRKRIDPAPTPPSGDSNEDSRQDNADDEITGRL